MFFPKSAQPELWELILRRFNLRAEEGNGFGLRGKACCRQMAKNLMGNEEFPTPLHLLSRCLFSFAAVDSKHASTEIDMGLKLMKWRLHAVACPLKP